MTLDERSAAVLAPFGLDLTTANPVEVELARTIARLTTPRGAPLTPLQRQMLIYIRDYTTREGYAPMFEDLQKKFKLRSTASVSEHLTNLERKGFIARRQRISRGIELLPPAENVRG